MKNFQYYKKSFRLRDSFEFIARFIIFFLLLDAVRIGIHPEDGIRYIALAFILLMLVELPNATQARIVLLEGEIGKMKEYIRILDMQNSLSMPVEEKKELDRRIAGRDNRQSSHSPSVPSAGHRS